MTYGNPNNPEHEFPDLEALYETLRASVVLKAVNSNVELRNDMTSFMYFHLPNAETSDAQEVQSNGNDVLIILSPRTLPGEKRSELYIRFLFSQMFMVDYGREFLTHDVTVYHDDDSQHLVDSSYVPHFDIVNGNLTIINYHDFTRAPGVSMPSTHPDEELVVVYPFGNYTNIDDLEHAMYQAHRIFNLVATAEPDYWSIFN
jgi:hypothetical protein